jgi:hypothetical protein
MKFMPESGLTEAETLEAIEVAVARTLTHALQTNVIVRVEEQLQILVYPSGGGTPTTLNFEDIDRKLRRQVQHQVDLELQLRKTLNEAEHLKELRGYTAPGEITRVDNDGTLIVSLEIADHYRRLILSGICPARFQPTHERGRYIPGAVKEFHITSVVPIMINHMSTRVRVQLSRISKELPRLLLQERSRISGIQCLKRIPGAYSTIVTPARIPKGVINSVGKELEEHLHVSIHQTHR